MFKQVVIFGASKAGVRLKRLLLPVVKVVAFCDNDPKKQGEVIDGIKVISPEQLASICFDKVLIGSMYEYEIYDQLIDLGVPKSKIIRNPDEFSWDGLVFLVVIILLIYFAVF